MILLVDGPFHGQFHPASMGSPHSPLRLPVPKSPAYPVTEYPSASVAFKVHRYEWLATTKTGIEIYEWADIE
mgnify:CR=1 FL=1